jgi:type IV pilus assembly protein PilC
MAKKVYNYKARDVNGIAVSGQVEAESVKTVSHSLKELGYIVVSIEESRQRQFTLLRNIKNRFSTVSGSDVLLFLSEMSAMVTAGLPLANALANAKDQTKNPHFRKILINITSDVRGGKSLSESFSHYPRLFTAFHVNMIKAGETGGMLGVVLERLAAIGYEERELKGKVQGAFAYPLLLIMISLFIITSLLIFVLPKFVDIFQESGTQLPVPTEILLLISGMLRRFWWLLLAGIIAAGFFINRALKDPKGRYRMHKQLLNLPVFGRIILIIAVSRFCKILSALTKSGIPLLEGLAVSEGLLGNQVLSNAISHVRQAVTVGTSLSESLKVSGVFPTMMVQMISVGESTGKLDDMLFQIGDFYDKESTMAIRTMSTLLEPVLLLIMGVIVGFIALSVLLPIFNLAKVLKH